VNKRKKWTGFARSSLKWKASSSTENLKFLHLKEDDICGYRWIMESQNFYYICTRVSWYYWDKERRIKARKLRKHPLYLRMKIDKFDRTYVYWYFKKPKNKTKSKSKKWGR
jgi:hypothetical protein